MRGLRAIFLALLFLFALAGGITLLVRQSPPRAIEIILPTAASLSVAENPEEQDLINVNTATLTELDTLRGIGPVKGQAIIDYREEYGPFNTVDDLLNVKGIGTETLENIRDQISVE